MSNHPAFFHLNSPDVPDDIWLMIRVVSNAGLLHDFSYSLADRSITTYLWNEERSDTKYAWSDVEAGCPDYPIAIVPRSFV